MGNKRTIFEAARNIVRRENLIITTKQFEDFKKQRQMEENQTKTTDHERHSETDYQEYESDRSKELASLREQLKQKEEVIRELIPIAERMEAMCRRRGKGEYGYKVDSDKYKLIIDKAKKLLEPQ